MPIINKIPLRTVKDVSRPLDYLGDSARESHRNHSVETPRYLGRATSSKADFLAELSRAITFLNGERSPSNQLRISATWWTLSFPTKSHLTNHERLSYEAAMLAAIGCSEFAAMAWHDNIFNGGADLNVIDPGIALGGIPSLRRSNTTNLLKHVRTLSDQWLRRINSNRVDEGVAPIQAVIKAQAAKIRKAPRVELLQLLGETCRQHSLIPSVNTLTGIIGKTGLSSDAWEVDEDNRLLVWSLPGKAKRPKKHPLVRIQMGQLIREIIEVVEEHEISLEIRDIPDSETKSSPPVNTSNVIQPSGSNVLPPLRTTPDVIHAAEEPKKEEIKR